MVKSSIGELKLSPIKEDGMFVFFNDFVTINGKVSKGDNVKVFVNTYQQLSDGFAIDPSSPAKAKLTVRGKESQHENITGYKTLDLLYEHVSTLYKNHFYFGDGN